MVSKLTVVVLVTSLAAMSLAAQVDPKDEVRKQIADAYAAWDTASVAGDIKTMTDILAPDFTSIQGTQKATKDEAVKALTRTAIIVKTDRLTTQIFTLTQNGDQWTAVISERLEADMKTPRAGKLYAQFVYRDTWRQTGKQWLLVTSEGIGSEYWRNTTPPDWNS
jgi:ketosteroid isomerase-like protein